MRIPARSALIVLFLPLTATAQQKRCVPMPNSTTLPTCTAEQVRELYGEASDPLWVDPTNPASPFHNSTDIWFEEMKSRVNSITERIESIDPEIPQVPVILTGGGEVNAHSSVRNRYVVIPAGIIDFIGSDDSELAFVVAHELGHVYMGDRGSKCGRVRMSPSKQRGCEAEADRFAIMAMLAARYDPYGATGVLGKFMAYQGDDTDRSIAVTRFISDHPANVDRIAQVRMLILAMCQNAERYGLQDYVPSTCPR